MALFKVIRGGAAFVDPDEIQAPEKPIEEWEEEDQKAYFLECWNHAQDSTVAYAVKKLDMPPASIASALDVLEAIKDSCAAGAKRTGLRNEFHYETLPHLLYCLRQRLEEDKATLPVVE